MIATLFGSGGCGAFAHKLHINYEVTLLGFEIYSTTSTALIILMANLLPVLYDP